MRSKNSLTWLEVIKRNLATDTENKRQKSESTLRYERQIEFQKKLGLIQKSQGVSA